MDPQGPMADQSLTEDEKVKAGFQQAAMIEMNRDAEIRERAKQQQIMLERMKEQDLMEAQQKALKMQQDQERMEQLKIMQQQAQALQERQKEEELKRLQEHALRERQQESEAAASIGGGQRLHSGPGMQPPPISGPPGFPMTGQQSMPSHMGPGQSSQGPPPQIRGPMMAPRNQGIPQIPGPVPPPLQRPPVSMSSGPPPFSQSQQRGPQSMMQPPPPGISMAQTGPSNDQLPKPREGPGRDEGPSFQHMGGAGPSEGAKRGVPSLMSVETRPPSQRSEDNKDEGSKPSVNDEEEKEEESESNEFKLPQALEKILAFKDVRVQEVGVKPEEMEKIEKGELIQEEEPEAEVEEPVSVNIEEYEEEEEEAPAPSKAKESKNKKRKKKKKKAKQRKSLQPQLVPPQRRLEHLDDDDDDVEVEYITEEPIIERTDPSYREFSKIFKAFKIEEPDPQKEPAPKVELTTAQKMEGELGIKARAIKELGEEDQFEGSDQEAEVDDDKPRLSKKKLKKLNRLSVAELKQLVTRPDVVEMHDVTARDPKLLINLKATRNTVPVPRHWCFKRKYLQGKRGIEKPPFDLPDFIKNTGIMEMRQALQEKEEAKNLKSKMREKVRPKMGKIDIDYQKLHDAFFKYQTKPKMSIHGDLYYEGKEFETRLKEKKPGNLTDDLRTALGMPLGHNAEKYPPPWLIAMQRYGPPPSYPNLKVAGLNAPIPESCAFGYHAGGWGKPPVDENGKPLYGDVFGTQGQEAAPQVEEEEVDRTRWGELESESEEESESESESEEEREAIESGLVTPGDTGLVTPSGVTSVPVGMETPDMIELRKKRIEDAMDQGGDTPALYQVIPEKKAAVGAAMMGSAHVYDISAVAAPAPARGGGENAEGVEVVLNPDELDMDTAAMQAKYEQQVREQQSQLEKEDLSDMVADHAAKQAKKRKKQQQDTSKSAKKYKDFKF